MGTTSRTIRRGYGRVRPTVMCSGHWLGHYGIVESGSAKQVLNGANVGVPVGRIGDVQSTYTTVEESG